MAAITNQDVLKDKADQLNNLAWEIRVSDSIRAKELSKEAIDIAEALNYSKGRAEGYRTFGFSFIRLSQHDEALLYLKQALSLFEELDDIRGQSTIFEYIGIIERSRGNLSSSLEYLFKGLEFARQAKYGEGECLSLYHLGVTYKYLGAYEQALEYLLLSLSISTESSFWMSESYCINMIGQIHYENADYTNALEYYQQSLAIRRKTGDKWGEAGCLDNIGLAHFEMKAYDEAKQFCNESLSITRAIGDKKGQGNTLLHLGLINQKLDNTLEAVELGNLSLAIRREIGDKKGEAEILLFLAELHLKIHSGKKYTAEAIELLKKAIELAEQTHAIDLLAKIHLGFYEVYKQIEIYREALIHLETYLKLSKEIHTEAVNKQIQNLEISHRIEKTRQEAEIYRLRNIELAALYEAGKRQKEEIELQKKFAEDALAELKETQKQLIQSEKMASLGELTAGIAHEIQNPLNFVNNFSDVNKELIEELQGELKAGAKEEAIAIADDIKENEEKINHHGKRADAIVKGMLQHSRANTGKKEPTDINALADEYLRLAYHGLRAKDKDFNADFKTDFDESIGNIEVVPQDIGRVLLNLYNNAFYAASLPFKGGKNGADNHVPTVWVSTRAIKPASGGLGVSISVRDNGPGIPQKVVDKIFQPFFTTKPTGQGTGLGLSLSYDIIKSHGGELKVETKEGEYAEFTVTLSVS